MVTHAGWARRAESLHNVRQSDYNTSIFYDHGTQMAPFRAALVASLDAVTRRPWLKSQSVKTVLDLGVGVWHRVLFSCSRGWPAR